MLTNKTILSLVVSVIVLVDCIASMFPRLSVASYELFHVAKSSVHGHVLSRVNLYLHGKKQYFSREVLHGTAFLHVCRSEIINEW